MCVFIKKIVIESKIRAKNQVNCQKLLIKSNRSSIINYV